MLDRLTPEQVKHIEQGIAEENRKFARENLRGSERERRERRAQRIFDRLEDGLGNLSKAQVARTAPSPAACGRLSARSRGSPMSGARSDEFLNRATCALDSIPNEASMASM